MMKKKELIVKIQQLINSVDALHGELKVCKKENEELKAELETLKSKPKTEAASVDIEETVSEGGFKVITEEEKPQEPKSEVSKPQEKIVLPDDAMEYGSQIIGKIIVESAKYAENISALASDNKKELLNLIMGRGEVAKAEIYNIATGAATLEIKKELIDSELGEAVDYFKSVAGQI